MSHLFYSHWQLWASVTFSWHHAFITVSDEMGGAITPSLRPWHVERERWEGWGEKFVVGECGDWGPLVLQCKYLIFATIDTSPLGGVSHLCDVEGLVSWCDFLGWWELPTLPLNHPLFFFLSDALCCSIAIVFCQLPGTMLPTYSLWESGGLLFYSFWPVACWRNEVGRDEEGWCGMMWCLAIVKQLNPLIKAHPLSLF